MGLPKINKQVKIQHIHDNWSTTTHLARDTKKRSPTPSTQLEKAIHYLYFQQTQI